MKTGRVNEIEQARKLKKQRARRKNRRKKRA